MDPVEMVELPEIHLLVVPRAQALLVVALAAVVQPVQVPQHPAQLPVQQEAQDSQVLSPPYRLPMQLAVRAEQEHLQVLSQVLKEVMQLQLQVAEAAEAAERSQRFQVWAVRVVLEF
jgi:hypothetical protein